MKTRLVKIGIPLISFSVFFFFTSPSNFDFLLNCPEGYWPENLFCYPDNIMVDTIASDWPGRIMMITDPIIFDPNSTCEENCH